MAGQIFKITETEYKFVQSAQRGSQGPKGDKGDVGDVTADVIAAKTAAEAARDDAISAKNAATDSVNEIAITKRYGAVGDGVTNDSDAFNSLEAANLGRAVDLNGKTHLVNSIPKKNLYYNGIFKVGSYTRQAALSDTLLAGVPKRRIFGDQIEKLSLSLANPLEQYTGIVFLGDSITWGLLLAENPEYETGRDGTLSDRRDIFNSPSWVNNVKRHIGEKYFGGATPSLGNWSASPSGEAIAVYSKECKLYPYNGDFTITSTGTGNGSVYSVQTGSSLLGWQLQLIADSNGNKVHTLSFPFTGNTFTLSFDATTSALDYELFVDNVSQGAFSTTPGVDGIVAGFDKRRTHTFTYVRNKTIKIVTKQAGYVGSGILRLGAIIVPKKVRIANQGIIGQTAKKYLDMNMTGNTSGDGVAVGAYDNYVFVQLGANDRLIDPSNCAGGSNEFKINLKALVNTITALGSDVILMVSNPVSSSYEEPLRYSFSMQEARGVIYRLAKENNLDFIDNYAAFEGLDTTAFTADGLHPNRLGHQAIARNIINSIEC